MSDKKDIHITKEKKECAVLVGVVGPRMDRSVVDETVEELSNLAKSAGADVSEIFIQKVKSYDAYSYIGKGKAQEIANKMEMLGADMVIFDDDLTPAQAKNLSGLIKKKIIDRTGLILEIFAQNAQTREAKTQVEMAQLEYQLPRLRGQWTHLERQVGGIGVRGPGETQLETDKRLVRGRMRKLKSELEMIEKQRSGRRSRRGELFKVAIVGYTNAGKSTLFNALTDAGVLVEDKLFATLDSTVRQLDVNKDQKLLLSDTVGFIRKLPHSLVASFRSTFGVVRDADILVHLVDLSYHDYAAHIEAVDQVLSDMELEDKKRLLVFNKVDLVDDDEILLKAKEEWPDAVFISAGRQVGITPFLEALSKKSTDGYKTVELSISIAESKLISQLFSLGEVLEQTFNEETTEIKVRASFENLSRIEALLNRTKC